MEERRGAARWDAARTGRRIAAGLHALLILYVIGAGLISVVPQIFWPAEAAGDAPPPDVSSRAECGRALGALHDDLLDGAAARVREPSPASSDRDPLGPWLDAWDERYRALEAPCGDLSSYALLARLRYGVEEHLLRFQAEEASLAVETRRAIEADTSGR